MSRRAAAAGMVVALVLAVGLMAGGSAWAAPELRLDPDSGPPGSTFTVTGSGFGASEVEIRWDSESGDELGTATGPDFSVTATVPGARPDSHQVVALTRDGSAVSTSNASFRVTPAPEPVETTTVAETTNGRESGPGTGSDGLNGSLDPVMGDSADITGGESGGDAGAVATAPGVTTTSAALAGTPPAPGASSLPPSGRPDAATADGEGADAGGRALGDPSSTSQSSGAVRSQSLLLAGLAMVFGGGVFLAVRNRHRISPEGGASAE